MMSSRNMLRGMPRVSGMDSFSPSPLQVAAQVRLPQRPQKTMRRHPPTRSARRYFLILASASSLPQTQPASTRLWQPAILLWTKCRLPTDSLPGPFAGQAMNCRSCHFVNEFQGVSGAGNRTYADFTTRSPIPRPQPNGFDHTPRNAMQIVGSFTSRSGPMFLHFDGEFATGEDLVIGTLTGPEFGWYPSQYTRPLRISPR